MTSQIIRAGPSCLRRSADRLQPDDPKTASRFLRIASRRSPGNRRTGRCRAQRDRRRTIRPRPPPRRKNRPERPRNTPPLARRSDPPRHRPAPRGSKARRPHDADECSRQRVPGPRIEIRHYQSSRRTRHARSRLSRPRTESRVNHRARQHAERRQSAKSPPGKMFTGESTGPFPWTTPRAASTSARSRKSTK